jgi:hypothetical protein
VVALTILGLVPDYCDRVVIEDPPAISDTPMEHDIVADLEETVRATRADPAGTRKRCSRRTRSGPTEMRRTR